MLFRSARLLQDDQPLLRRIALDVLVESIDQLDNKSVDHVSELNEHEATLAAQAAVVLGDELFIEHNYKPEFYKFIRACLSWRAAIDLSPFFDAIRLGPLALRDDRRERFAHEGDTEDDVAARIEIYEKHWQHSLLTLVGAGGLPDDLSELLASLDTEYGPLEVSEEERSEERRVGKECRSRWSPYK